MAITEKDFMVNYTQRALDKAYKDGKDGKPHPCAGELYLQWDKGYQIYKRLNKKGEQP